MIHVSEKFWNDCVDLGPYASQTNLKSEDIEIFLRKTVYTAATCKYDAVVHAWRISLPPKYETLFRLKYSDYIV